MTIKTPLNPENAAAHFFERNTDFEVTAFGQGNINDTWKLTVSHNGQTQPYLLQRLNHLVFRQPEQVMANESVQQLYFGKTVDA